MEPLAEERANTMMLGSRGPRVSTGTLGWWDGEEVGGEWGAAAVGFTSSEP